MSRASARTLVLRPVTASDADFLRALYAETRAREVAGAGWSPEFQQAFLRGQFEAQQTSYRQEFPGAAFDVVLAAGKPVGRLYVAHLPEWITVVDITLIPAARGRGWGTALLQEVFTAASRAGLPVRLSLDSNNRAQRLYDRLGFRQIGQSGFYRLLERPAA